MSTFDLFRKLAPLFKFMRKKDHHSAPPSSCCCGCSCSQSDAPYVDSHQGETGGGHSGARSELFWLIGRIGISCLLLIVGLGSDHIVHVDWLPEWGRLLWYVLAYLPVGLPVLRAAVVGMTKGSIFSEFFLMGIATGGAFAIGEYPEAVAVMLFYTVGEMLQAMAVARAKGNISRLLDQRPDEVTLMRDDRPVALAATAVGVGELMLLKPGEKLALDGELVSEIGSFNASALTGESVPETKQKGDTVLAGMINLHAESLVRVTTLYEDSKLSRILDLVQNASARKAPTELFIRRFARIYTPIVVALAVLITLLPALFVEGYVLSEWLYRALVFLVISCPCALVISIPLGYFGGIGAAGKHGILFKGGNYLDALASIRNVVVDKTGTMTEGVFSVQEVVFDPNYDSEAILRMVNALEAKSTHPVATAIRQHVGEPDHSIRPDRTEEVVGQGLKAWIDGKEFLVGNFHMMDMFGISHAVDLESLVHTAIAVAYGGRFVGYMTIADRVKADARQAIASLKTLGIKTTMLSGDRLPVVGCVAEAIGVDAAYGALLPEDKLRLVQEIKAKGESVAFVGDGMNDAPVVALSDVGIAMGGLGSDATIETADVVIQDDKPGKIAMAIRIGRETKRIVRQNIVLAFGVKAIVLILGAWGMAAMWEAVFADVGVALLAVLNAVRIQRMSFER